jgi:hypothetical protein
MKQLEKISSNSGDDPHGPEKKEICANEVLKWIIYLQDLN